MQEALKCPSCSAPLEYPATGGPTLRCPYCNTIVMLSDPAAQRTTAFTVSIGSKPGVAIDLTQIHNLLQSGNKIAAIKVYREMHGVGLADAKAAIDALAPRSAAAPGSATTVVVSKGAGFRLGIILLSILVPVVIAIFSLRSVRIPPAQSIAPVIPIPSGVPTPPPPPPAYAHQTLEFGSEGIGPGQFKDARSVAVGPDGTIYVGEYSDGRVQVFDSAGKFQAEWTIGKNKSLMSLAADRHGSVYVVVPFNIFRYDGATGMPQGQVENVFNDTQENYMDACVALNGDVFAVTSDSNVVDIAPDGKIKTAFSAGEKVGEDLSLERIAVLPTGEIYCLDRSKGIFKFGSDGRYINRFGPTDDPDTGVIVAPEALAVDGNGRIYESASNPAIRVFTSDGNPLDTFGGNDVVFGLAIDDHNQIFAAYRNDHTIRKFVIDKK